MNQSALGSRNVRVTRLLISIPSSLVRKGASYGERRRRWMVLAAALFAGGCAIGGGQRQEVANYDFGPMASNGSKAVLSRPLLVYDVTSPAWMDSTAVFYRLAYRDPARPQAYTGSRWVMPPAALLSARLRQRLSAASSAGIVTPADAVRAEAALRLELDEFSQVFDASDRSRALVRARATLVGSRVGVRQQTFSIEKTASPPGAEGGVRSLAAASDELIEQLLGWLKAQMKN